ncbi:AfsR/SARP family transcriptional regulator [Nonomuraea cavernae]|uniref:AfsR/SARP family transcriptional regulator n=1 Tax=Nonomuraea cavernae TaxID=2045107 RepID=UPI0033DE3142
MEAWYEGRRLALGGPKPRALLAALLLTPRHVVSNDRLISLLWNERPPESARALIHTYVSALRRRLADVGEGDMIERRAPGYLLHLRDGQLDREMLDRFVDEGRRALDAGAREDAAVAFEAASALWRGTSLGGIGEVLRAEAASLDEIRLKVIEERIAVQLSLGHYGDSMAELTALVGTYPQCERLRGHLMTALYALGRQSDALAVYHEGRAALHSELGIDPGPELQHLYEAMLRGQLWPPQGSSPETPAVVEPETHPSHTVAPAQLPPDIPDFTGRTAVLADLVAQFSVAGHAPPVCVISGKAGVGKSALAVHTAHLLADSYPDGQLFADLRGGGDSPASPQEVLTRFLRGLGIESARIPETFQERVDLYRSIMSRQRVLVVLDDVRSEQQTRPLLPGGSNCAVLVTSRGRLPGLAGAHLTDLDVLNTSAAMELFAAVVGQERVAVEPDAAADIVRLCGGLPLAVRTAGARLRTRRQWPIATMARKLSDERHRLDELSAGDLEVRSSIGLSYRLLDDQAKAAFRRLGVLGMPDFASWIVGPLLDQPAQRAEEVVERLVDAQLLDYVTTDAFGQVRYRLHDLLRVYAREQAEKEEPVAELAQAVSRVLGSWLWLITQATKRTPPGEVELRSDYTTARPVDASLAKRLLADPAAWLESDTPALIAAVDRAATMDLDVAVCDISAAMSCSVFFAGSRVAEWRSSHDSALAAARRAGNCSGEATLLAALGQTYYELDQFTSSYQCFTQALALFAETGDNRGEAVVLVGIGGACRELSRYQEALDYLTRAADFFRLFGDDTAVGHTSRVAASIHLELGAFHLSRPLLQEALTSYRAVGSKRGEALTLRTISLLHRALGDHSRAESLCAQALSLLRSIGDEHMAAYTQQALAKAQIRLGRGKQALPALEQALAICGRRHDRWGEALVHRTIGELHLAEGRLEAAATHLGHAITLWDSLDTPLPAARARRDLAEVRRAAGDFRSAEQLSRHALRIFAKYDAREHTELTAGDHRTGDLNLLA